tara:strand:+ start:322 stop:1026 length:705 start_codon:yes stop_codon:yes gene_type:complete
MKNILYIFIFFPLMLSKNLAIAEEVVMTKHIYHLYKGNLHFATSENTLLRHNDKWKYLVSSYTAGVFKLKKDLRTELSKFNVINDNVFTKEYTYNRIRKDNEDVITTMFNNKNNSAHTVNNGKKIKHSQIENLQDRLSVQIDYQNKMKTGDFEQEYNVIDKGRERKYIFSIHDGEVIDTIFGKTNTIIIRKIIKDNKRNTLTWYAVDHNFIPVKIQQYRKKSLKFTVILEKIVK